MNIKSWISDYKTHIKYKIENVSLREMDGWKYNEETDVIERFDQAFFSVIAVKSPLMIDKFNELPLINQPEIGILGFIINQTKTGTKILLQAKSEPGNVGLTQIGPSVQATKSNYTSKHHGKNQKYIEYFLDVNYPKKIELKQSEQGTRFFNKYNLNTIIHIDEKLIKIEEEKYKWFYLEEIIESLHEDYLYNTDFKSVFSLLIEDRIIQKKYLSKSYNPFLKSYFNNKENDVSPIIQSINKTRKEKHFNVSITGISKLQNWFFSEKGISSKNILNHGIQFFNIELDDREIPAWGQPLITKQSQELIVLLCFAEKGEMKFVFRERPEIGFTNFIQLAPTIQFDFLETSNNFSVNGKCLIEFYQSEEGGRFFKNISKYSIYEIEKSEIENMPDSFKILDLYQICQLLKIEGIFTNEARSIVTGITKLI
ncbi:MAG: NDP-hexose 2,3-dehydratase family protein [bacterium]